MKIFVIIAKTEDDKPILWGEFENMRCSVITKKYNTTCSQPTEFMINGFSICSHCFDKMIGEKKTVVFIEIPININPDTIGKSIFVKEI